MLPEPPHHEQALGALRAGKHVVCEKPLAMTSAQAIELCDVAQRTQPRQCRLLHQPLLPALQDAAARVSRVSRDVRLVTGPYLQDWLAKDTDWNWRLDPASAGRCGRSATSVRTGWIS